MKNLTNENRLFLSNTKVNDTQEPLLHVMKLVNSGAEFRFEVVMSFAAKMSVDDVKKLNDYIIENKITSVMNLSTVRSNNVHLVFKSVLNNLGVQFNDFVVELREKLDITNTKNIPRTINILSSLIISPNFVVGGLCDTMNYASSNTQKIMGLYLSSVLDKDLSSLDLKFLNEFLQVKELQSTLRGLKRYCKSSLIVPLNTLGRLNGLTDDCDRLIESMHSFCYSVKNGTNITCALSNNVTFNTMLLAEKFGISKATLNELKESSFTVLDYLKSIANEVVVDIHTPHIQLGKLVKIFEELDSVSISSLTQSDIKCVRLLDRLISDSGVFSLFTYSRGFHYVMSPAVYNAVAVELLQLIYDVKDSSELELEEVKFIVNGLLNLDYSKIDRYFFKLEGKSAFNNPVGVIHVDNKGKVSNVLGYKSTDNKLTCNKNKVVFPPNELEEVKLSLNSERRDFIAKYFNRLDIENPAYIIGLRVKKFMNKDMSEEDFRNYLYTINEVIFNGAKNYMFRKVYSDIHKIQM